MIEAGVVGNGWQAYFDTNCKMHLNFRNINMWRPCISQLKDIKTPWFLNFTQYMCPILACWFQHFCTAVQWIHHPESPPWLKPTAFSCTECWLPTALMEGLSMMCLLLKRATFSDSRLLPQDHWYSMSMKAQPSEALSAPELLWGTGLGLC